MKRKKNIEKPSISSFSNIGALAITLATATAFTLGAILPFIAHA